MKRLIRLNGERSRLFGLVIWACPKDGWEESGSSTVLPTFKRESHAKMSKILELEMATSEKTKEKRQWPLKLWECYSYRDLKGNQRWCPTFCCTALICTNMLAGRVCTQIVREKPCFCGLGLQGCLVCLVTLPIDASYPVLGAGIYCCLANFYRCRIVEQYNVEEEQLCCCGRMNWFFNYLLFGINYPCSLFQMNMSVERWEEEAKNDYQGVAMVTAQPVASTTVVDIQPK
eukprot:gene10527-11463_t